MKKQYFSILIFAICVAMFTFSLVACKPSPCTLSTAKGIDDDLIKKVVDLGNGTYAVYIDYVKYQAASGLVIKFSRSNNYWPAAIVQAKNDSGEYSEGYNIDAQKDSCGFYLILQSGEQRLRLSVKQSGEYSGIMAEAFGAYVCDSMPYNVCFDPKNL